MSHYNPDKCLRIPADSRLWIAGLWGVAVGLLIYDSIDGRPGIIGRWAFFIGLTALGWTCALMHSYSRRVIIEVMSWEHQQQGMGVGGDDDTHLSLVDRQV